MIEDLFETDKYDSLLRFLIRETRIINLKDFKTEEYKIPSNYDVIELNLNQKEYTKEIRLAIDTIVEIAEKKGCPSNLYTALYEAVLNAHQHGNKEDPNKRIKIAYNVSKNSIDIAVIDEGGFINPDFISYIIRHREQKHKEKFMDFYEFSNMKKPVENNGTGTLFMHLYSDKISYYKSDKGGLVVNLTKYF